MEDEFKSSVQPQRRVNPNIKEVVKKEVIRLIDARLIYPISDSPWVSHVQVVPKKGGMTVVKNEKNERIPQRTVNGWCVCIDYHKLNNVTQKDHFPLPFIDQMLERLAGHEYYCFLYGFSGYFQIPIALEDKEKTTFTCPYGTFAYKLMPFRLCNAPATFQHCMTAIFDELIKDSMEVFMDDFSVFSSSFDHCLKNLEKTLKSFYRRFVIDFSQVARPMTQLLVKDTPFNFSEECIQAFDKLKHELTQAPIMIKPDWSLPFEVMCDEAYQAEIRGPIPLKKRLMAVSDKNNEPWMNRFYSSNVLTESYKGASLEMRQHKSFSNVTVDHLEDIMVSPPLPEKSLKPVSTDHISFMTPRQWSKVAYAMVNEPAISLQGMKYLKNGESNEKVWSSSPILHRISPADKRAGNFSLKTKKNFSQTLETASGLTVDDVASPGMLYLMRRSLEVLRKLHWTIIGGRFNQLSHVSSLLLSKPGEY
ncbi:reverse transcriptase domain-containing protein [Tanacetum coccineum]